MRNLVSLIMLVALAVPAIAASDEGVIYAGGTIAQPKAGAAGALDLSSGAVLRFTGPDGALEIPYDAIESFEHTNEVAVHLGVAPAIAVGIVAARRRNHFVRITCKDSNHVAQVAVFQVPKSTIAFLMPALAARTRFAQCTPYAECLSRPIAARVPTQTPASAVAAAPSK